jgi:4-amino-4-deoxy-L-arabinose transferase-like glycosyltransferase
VKYFKFFSLLILCLVAVLILCKGIAYQSIDKKSDEIIHLRVIQEMYHSGDLLHPTYNGDAYYNKPPLKMWLTLIPISILGESNFSYRVIEAFLGLTLITLSLIFSKNLFRSITPGIIAGFVLLLSKELIWGAHGFRKGTQDSLLLVLLTASYILLWEILNKKNKKTEYLFCILVGLATLTKSVAGLLPLVIYSSYILVEKKKLKDKFLEISALSIKCITLPALYYGYHCLKSPVAWKKFFYIELYERATKGMHHINEPYFYIREIFYKSVFTFPIVTICALIFALAFFRKNKAINYLLVLASIPIILFSIPNSRLPWYIFPSYLPLSLLIGYFITALIGISKNSSIRYKRILCTLLLTYFLFIYSVRLEKIIKHSLTINKNALLEIDKLTHRILNDPSLKIFVDPSLIDTRPLVGRRQTNRDAFYWTMIEDRISPEINFTEGILVIPESQTEQIQSYEKAITEKSILPKARTRKEEALVLTIN